MEPQSLAVFGKSSGGGPKKSCWDDRAWTMVMNNDSEEERSSPSINLGLGIGATAVSAISTTGTSGSTSSGQTHVNIKREKKLLLLTPSQLNELRQQSLIYKYLLAGLPVPLHLLLPIWKSVVASSISFGSSNGACIYKQFPSLIGFSSQGFDYRTMMEPEPGRCRRTDGKKWRCKRDVVPNNKYCERHVNRGRQRSRKHVEAPEIAAPIHPTLPVNTNNSEKSNTYQPVSVPTSLQLSTPTYDNNRTSNATPSTISANSNNERRNITFGHRKDSAATYTITTTSTIPTPPSTTIASSTAAANNITSSSNNVHKEGTRVNHVKRYRNVGKSRKNLDIGSSFPPVLGFSPKSVIEGAIS